MLVSCKPYRASACASSNYTKDSNLNSPCCPFPCCQVLGSLCSIHHIIDRNFEIPIIRSCLQPLLVLFNYHFFSKHFVCFAGIAVLFLLPASGQSWTGSFSLEDWRATVFQFTYPQGTTFRKIRFLNLFLFFNGVYRNRTCLEILSATSLANCSITVLATHLLFPSLKMSNNSVFNLDLLSLFSNLYVF